MAVLGLCCCIRTFSSCGERGLLFIAMCGLLIAVASLVAEHTGSRCAGFSSCGTRAQQLWLVDSRAQAQQLWHMGLVVPRHVGSSQTRAQTCVPCTGRWILNHCITREVPALFFMQKVVCFDLHDKSNRPLFFSLRMIILIYMN